MGLRALHVYGGHLVCMEDTGRTCLGVYGGHGTDLPVYGRHGTDLPVHGGHGTDLPWCVWRTPNGLACVWRTPNGLACVWRTQDGLALVLSLMRAQAEYRLAFAVSGIRDVTVECTDVTVVWWCDVSWERRGPAGRNSAIYAREPCWILLSVMRSIRPSFPITRQPWRSWLVGLA